MQPNLLIRAAELLERTAAEIAASFVVRPDFSDWTGAEGEKAGHDEMLVLAAELRGAAPVQELLRKAFALDALVAIGFLPQAKVDKAMALYPAAGPIALHDFARAVLEARDGH